MNKQVLFLLFCSAVMTGEAHASSLDVNFESTTNQGAMVGRTYDGLMQTITVGTAGILDSVELKLTKQSSSVVEDATIGLWSTSGGAPNSSLASWTLSAASAGLSYGWINVDVSGLSKAVSVGDVFGISMSSSGEWAWNAGVGTNASYDGGIRYSDGAGGTVAWNSLASWDFSVRTYVDTTGTTPAVPIPASLPLLAGALLGAGAWLRQRKSKS